MPMTHNDEHVNIDWCTKDHPVSRCLVDDPNHPQKWGKKDGTRASVTGHCAFPTLCLASRFVRGVSFCVCTYRRRRVAKVRVWYTPTTTLWCVHHHLLAYKNRFFATSTIPLHWTQTIDVEHSICFSCHVKPPSLAKISLTEASFFIQFF